MLLILSYSTTGSPRGGGAVVLLQAEDDDALNGVATIEHSASGANYGSVSVSSVTATEADNDTAGVTITVKLHMLENHLVPFVRL